MKYGCRLRGYSKTGLRNAYERPQLHEVKLAVNVLYEKILLPNNVGAYLIFVTSTTSGARVNFFWTV